MAEFNSIYPFTTENIAGYMDGMNMTGKSVITVTGSSDHVINAILNGSRDITTFDINPLCKYYMELKLAAIKKLSFEQFLKVFLYRSMKSLDKDIILSLPLPIETKEFFKEQLALYGNNGLELKRSSLFHISYFNPETTIWQNMYLNKKNYNIVKKRIDKVKIRFVSSDVRYLTLDREYDFMFLSNIADYINEMYSEPLKSYGLLMNKFLEHVKQIYIAYLYDIGSNTKRSDIYDIEMVKRTIPGVRLDTFSSVYEGKRDGVLILRRK